MAQPLRLEVFETFDIPDGPALMTPEQIEDIRLSAYERGYLAGWEDGGTQVDADASVRRSAIERQIDSLSFTYLEAQGHILKALRPVFESMVATVLPEAARASVVPVLIEALLPLAQAAATAPVLLRLPRGARGGFEAATEGLVMPPLEIHETDDLAQGQAEFVFGTAETRIDLTHAADLVGRAIDSFYDIQCEEIRSA